MAHRLGQPGKSKGGDKGVSFHETREGEGTKVGSSLLYVLGRIGAPMQEWRTEGKVSRAPCIWGPTQWLTYVDISLRVSLELIVRGWQFAATPLPLWHRICGDGGPFG